MMENSELLKIDKEWTLFLDRDGVINERPVDDYVRSWNEFKFMPGVPEALRLLAARFGKIIVITNQQGIGKNLMTSEDLLQVHHKMTEAVEKEGGRIDAIYYCPDLETKPGNCRKPGLAMARRAAEDFPSIRFERGVMVGDTGSDMLFGKNGGLQTGFVGKADEPVADKLVDHRFGSLLAFAQFLSAND